MSARATLAQLRRFAGGGRRPLPDAVGDVASHAAGSFITTTDGARLLDAVSGYGVASLGHSHPHWVGAVTEQVRKLAVSPLHTVEHAECLAALAPLLPEQLRSIALHSTGAEAVEVAIRLVQTATGKPGVLTFERGFHGKTAAVRYVSSPASTEADLLAPRWLRTAPFPECVAHDAFDYPQCDEPVHDVLDALAETAPRDIGAVVVEPVLGTAGNLPPRRPFLSALRRLCDDRGWLLVFDESITGMGRLGRMFGFEYFEAVPDVLVLSKGLGGGFPVSAVCASTDLWAASALSAPSGTSSSYGANPLAGAAALATLEVVSDPEFLASVREVSAVSAVRLRELAAAHHEVERPRGVGLMLGFDLVDPATGAAASVGRCEAIVRSCRDRGLLVAAHTPRVRLSPPLTLSRDEARLLFDVLDDALR